jgi:hypothetical protein
VEGGERGDEGTGWKGGGGGGEGLMWGNQRLAGDYQRRLFARIERDVDAGLEQRAHLQRL